MGTFDDRQKAYENKFVHDQEREFKVRARANILTAKWAAEKMHFEGSDIDAYATEVVDYSFSNSGESAVIEKMLTDIRSKGFEVDEKEVKNQYQQYLIEAKESFK
ncbi:MAG: DUF1476 domain-containing protein [Rickettsiales bacterium]|nr:DUF1476 domain-containing protein [Pseudomonadota bacterium]MDA0966116.1 DUF1476 domain-containing protein [Pseudomonadota bacterium]MDG4543219.1 DUF1476 domain-containing protein [Rickettsiales bacterium]MDG4545417.1 DUF1476 domain-containing protein [Rickettsiales bacterium]MDG4547866.1 DUF1476 domain-containing protein [Rickettsiales bacterium]